MVEAAALAASVAKLDAWFETMRQEGGYGGPVVHWWNHSLRFAGAATDWRYEGLLIGYSELARRFGGHWHGRLEAAIGDVRGSQLPSGHYRASRFEANPGTRGTPHEAAASLGLITAASYVAEGAAVIEIARRNLDALLALLWQPELGTFVDAPGSAGVVPNKVATMAHALMELAVALSDESYLVYAASALRAVLRLQVRSGRNAGAIHQYAADGVRGDRRFFPLYIARCVPPLVRAAEILEDEVFLEAARAVGVFLERTMDPDGSWPQIVYERGMQADYPRWVAGAGDMLTVWRMLGENTPEVAVDRLVAAQLPLGGFPTAIGFEGRPDRRCTSVADLLPVVGWNDKAFRYLVASLPKDAVPVATDVMPYERCVRHRHETGSFREDEAGMSVDLPSFPQAFRWRKFDRWTSVRAGSLDAW